MTDFKIGDRVEVNTSDTALSDWRGLPLWVAGIVMEPPRIPGGEAKLNFWLAEHWPPRTGGDITDGWREGQFHRAATAATPA